MAAKPCAAPQGCVRLHHTLPMIFIAGSRPLLPFWQFKYALNPTAVSAGRLARAFLRMDYEVHELCWWVQGSRARASVPCRTARTSHMYGEHEEGSANTLKPCLQGAKGANGIKLMSSNLLNSTVAAARGHMPPPCFFRYQQS